MGTLQQNSLKGGRARLLALITQDPPVSVRHIAAQEGLADRVVRALIKQLEKEHGVTYKGWGLTYSATLSDETRSLRARLADQLYHLHQRVGDRREVAALVGLNRREQIRAVNRPFNHDWTLSQIERLSQATAQDLSDLGLRAA